MADGVTLPATGTGTADVKVASDDAGADGHVQIIKLAVSANGSVVLLPADATAGLKVDLGADNDVVSGGNVAHDDADSGNPIKIGGTANDAAPTNVANGDRVNAWFDTRGALFTTTADNLMVDVASMPASIGVVGNVGHDIGDSNSPVKIGGHAYTGTPAAVQNNDRVDGWFGSRGQIATMLVDSAGADLATAGDGVGLPVVAYDSSGNGGNVATNADGKSNALNGWITASWGYSFNGTTWDRMRGDTTNGLDVDVTRLPALPAGDNNIGNVDVVSMPTVTVNSHEVTNAGTFATQVDGAALTALQLIDDTVKVDDAGFTAGTDKVSMNGSMAVAHGSNPDAADANDAGVTLMNRHRIPFAIGGHPNIVTVKHANITTAVTDAAIITVSAGSKIVVTSIAATLDNASTVFPTLLVGFGAANTPTTTGVILAHGGVPAGGGIARGDGSGILGIGGDGEDLRVTTTGNATGNGLQIVVTYFTIES